MKKIISIGLLFLSSAISAGTLTVNSGANFTGTGNLTGDLVVEAGGNVAPSSGCLSVNNTSFSVGSSLSITIAGTTECGNYSQLQVNGTADLALADLNVVTDNYTLQINDEFIILANDGGDAITSTFNQLPEDGVLVVDGKDMHMSYLAGDSNDAGFRVVFRYDVNVNVAGLATGNVLDFSNGTDTHQVIADEQFSLSTLDDLSSYDVTFTSQINTTNQTCSFTSNNASGSVNGADVLINVYCNSEPSVMSDAYTAFEDIDLLANDADGSVAGVNDNGVFVNDSDADADTLSVVNPGTFTTTLLGGEISIAADGTFTYVPPADVSGQDSFAFNITDGIHTVGSSLSIEVLPVNDAPSFDIVGDVLNASVHPNLINKSLTISQFANNIVLGPTDESISQSVIKFTPTIFADSNAVLAVNGVSITNAGDLTLNFTTNLGVAIVQLILQDDGLTTNGGEDTSPIHEFVVSYSHLIFKDGFEEPVVNKLFNYLDTIKSKSPLRQYPHYDFQSNSIFYYDHHLKLNGNQMSDEMMQVIKLWIDGIKRVEEATIQ